MSVRTKTVRTRAVSPLAYKTSAEVVLGTRGAIHIAHPLSATTRCGVSVGIRLGVDAFGRTSVDGFGPWPHPSAPVGAWDACHKCQALTFAPGNEHRK